MQIASTLTATHLSTEHRMRLLLDTARANLQRRRFDDATTALIAAERIAPEHLRSHTVAHNTISELTARTRPSPSPELIRLARQVGAYE